MPPYLKYKVMSDKKISQLSSASTLTGVEPLAIVQGEDTVKTTLKDIADLAKYPNGIKTVPSSRDFEASDAGCILSIESINVSLTMPSVSPFTDNQNFAILSAANGITFNTEFEDDLVYSLGGTGFNEIIQIISLDGILYIINTGRVYDIDDDKVKTLNKFFYDKLITP